MLSVTTYASQLQTISNIKSSQASYNQLTTQIATGVKSNDLSDYSGTEAGRLVNSRQQVDRLEAYNKAIDIVTPELKTYDLQLSRMDELASSALKALDGMNTYDADSAESITSTIDLALSDLTSLLNEKVGGRYLWSGSNYDQAPVSDLGDLPVLGTADAFTAVAEPDLPDYYRAAPGSDDKAWSEASFSPETGKTVTYGQVATDPAIQRLVYGLQLAKSALANAAAATDETAANAAWASFSDQATTELTAARSAVQGVSGQVSIDLAAVNDSRSANTTMINIFKDEEDNIVSIDTAEAGVKLTQVQLQLSATYSVVSSLADTSLVKYL